MILALALVLSATPHPATTGANSMQDSPAPHAETESVAHHFNRLALQWIEHCKAVAFSSDINDSLDSDAYRQIVKLGPPAIPYIIQRYRHDDLPWGFALDDITGLHIIKDRNNFSPDQVKHDYLQWWEQYRKTHHTT